MYTENDIVISTVTSDNNSFHILLSPNFFQTIQVPCSGSENAYVVLNLPQNIFATFQVRGCKPRHFPSLNAFTVYDWTYTQTSDFVAYEPSADYRHCYLLSEKYNSYSLRAGKLDWIFFNRSGIKLHLYQVIV